MGTGKHTIAAIIFIIFMVFVIAVGLFVYYNSKGKEDGDYHDIKEKVTEIRAKYFYILMAVLLVLLGITLNMTPYPGKNPTKGAFNISVVAGQWYWRIAPGTLQKNGMKFQADPDLVIPVNKTINFQVTSVDVNHDFAIYNDQGTLIAQTQAMPDYVNQLRFKFTEPGTYHIACLEYCGMAHQNMFTEITVK